MTGHTHLFMRTGPNAVGWLNGMAAGAEPDGWSAGTAPHRPMRRANGIVIRRGLGKCRMIDALPSRIIGIKQWLPTSQPACE